MNFIYKAIAYFVTVCILCLFMVILNYFRHDKNQ